MPESVEGWYDRERKETKTKRQKKETKEKKAKAGRQTLNLSNRETRETRKACATKNLYHVKKHPLTSATPGTNVIAIGTLELSIRTEIRVTNKESLIYVTKCNKFKLLARLSYILERRVYDILMRS